MVYNILVVDDEQSIADLVELYLQNESYQVFKFYHGQEALDSLKKNHYDLAILDVMMPDLDGFSLLKKIREDYFFPVIMLTAKNNDMDKINGLTLGADDYLTKPFYLEELKMRIQALLKRSGKFSDNNLSYGELTVTTSTNTTTINGKEVEMLGKEFDLLVYFLQNQNVILPKSQIFDRIWGFDSDTTISVVEVYVSKIRKKLKGTTFAKNLQTLRSVGYILKNAE